MRSVPLDTSARSCLAHSTPSSLFPFSPTESPLYSSTAYHQGHLMRAYMRVHISHARPHTLSQIPVVYGAPLI